MTSVAYFVVRPTRKAPIITESCPMVKLHFELQRPEAPRLHGSETQRHHKSATDERQRGSPTGETPLQRQTSERRPAVGSSRRGVCRSLYSPWTDAEESAL